MVFRTLRVNVSIQTHMLPLIEDAPASSQLKDIELVPSTLLCFAKCDGLKYLSRFVDVLSRVDEKFRVFAEFSEPLSNAEYRGAKEEIVSARGLIKKSRSSFASNKNKNIYDSLFEALQQPAIIVYSTFTSQLILTTILDVYQMLEGRGIEFPDTKQTSTSQQPKPDVFGSFADYNFDIIDGISPSANTEEQMLSMFDFMSENASTSPKGAISKNLPVTKPTVYQPQITGLLSALPPTEEDWDIMEIPNMGANHLNTMHGNMDILNDIQGQLQHLQGQMVEKLQTLHSKYGTLHSKPPQTAVPSKKSRFGNPSNTPQQDFEHIMIALSAFFELDTYGQTFVEHDFISAKRLIYMFLGLTPPDYSVINYVIGLKPLLTHTQNSTQEDEPKTKSINTRQMKQYIAASKYLQALDSPFTSPMLRNYEPPPMDETMFVPFITLTRCFENATVEKVGAKAEQIRVQALNNGAIDLTLFLLAHYSSQQSKKKALRDSDDLLVTRLVHRLVSFINDSQSIVKLFNESKQKQRFASGKSLIFNK